MPAVHRRVTPAGGILDFPAECVRFSVVSADVPLVSIDTGHVGVPVRFPAGCLPAVSEDAIARAEGGAEVTACDEDTERLLMKDHRAMTVSKDAEPIPAPASEGSSECSGEDVENYVTFQVMPVSKPTRKRAKGRRMRAEPFF